MESIGIDWKILLIQAVNFLILFGLLSWLLYKPVLKFLRDRQKKIEDSLALAEKSRRESEELDQKTKEKIEEAKKEALAILEEAKKEAQGNKKEIQEEAAKEARAIMDKAKSEIEEEKRTMLASLKRETVNLTIATTEKLLKKNLTRDEQSKLISEATKEIK